MPRKFLVGGNWKMNSTQNMAKDLVSGLNEAKLDGQTEVIIAPPAIYLLAVREALHGNVQVAAQNCFTSNSGAYTGEIAPAQLKDCSISWVILGHSERRSMFGDTDKFVAEKTDAAIKEGLKVILCVGESLEEREKDITLEVVERQLDAVIKLVKKEEWAHIVIAYEPVWAIGTGKVASPQQAQEVHAAIRSWLSKTVSSEAGEATRIIYGGSVSGKNCKELASEKDIDGFLVGGASLKPEFIDICKSGQA